MISEKQRIAYAKMGAERKGKPRPRYAVRGLLAHNASIKKPVPAPRLCACGCGGTVVANSKKFLAKYLPGHAFRGTSAQTHQGVARRVAKLTGTHGHGLGTRGRLDHSAALFWVLRDPSGQTYEFTNLSEWVRQHIALFHDHNPESKLPLERRVTAGIGNLAHGNTPKGSYFGWTLVSVAEAQNDSRDLMGRDEAEIMIS